MPVAEPAISDRPASVASGSERLVDQLANRIGGLGVELADVAGNLQEVAGRVSGQSERFGHLQKTAETMVGGWLNTGDTYREDPDGYLIYDGRSDDMLKVGGIWCSPVEIEERRVGKECRSRWSPYH